MIGFAQAVLLDRCMRYMYMCRGRRTSAAPWEAGFQRIASQIARSLFACPSQELIARENFLDWLQSGVEASTALSEWTGGAGVLPSLNACRCLR